eukprot:1571315-Rhodomonas_salina.1
MSKPLASPTTLPPALHLRPLRLSPPLPVPAQVQMSKPLASPKHLRQHHHPLWPPLPPSCSDSQPNPNEPETCAGQAPQPDTPNHRAVEVQPHRSLATNLTAN